MIAIQDLKHSKVCCTISSLILINVTQHDAENGKGKFLTKEMRLKVVLSLVESLALLKMKKLY